MSKHNSMWNDIYENHQDRIRNLMKYLPFFRLQEVSFGQYKEGKYARLDMGYLLMAILRFFIEENNFNDRQVTYTQYSNFLVEVLQRDFGYYLEEQDYKEIVGYIFEKIKNDGKPFSLNYYDPIEKKTKLARTKLLESYLIENTVYYSITSDAIEFYLETKEIKDESKISIQQVLLEKMIESRNFSGGLDVVRRINSEVNKLRIKKQEVIQMLGIHVYEGVRALEEFNATGIRWFEEEQKAFLKNKELMQQAREKLEERIGENNISLSNMYEELFELEKELLKAISNHGTLLSDCMELQVKADEIIRKHKYSRLRNTFDFKAFFEKTMERNDLSFLHNLVSPLFEPKIKKEFYLGQIDDLLTFSKISEEEGEKIENEETTMYEFEDEVEEERISNNFVAIIKTLLDTILVKNSFNLKEFNEILEVKFFDTIFRNSDYYSFLVHLCQKKSYDLSEVKKNPDTFFEGILSSMLKEKSNIRYLNIRFRLELLSDKEDVVNGEQVEEIIIPDAVVREGNEEKFSTSNIRFIRY